MSKEKFLVGDVITFNFLGEIRKGVVVSFDIKKNKIVVKTNLGRIFRIPITKKDSEFLFLVNY